MAELGFRTFDEMIGRVDMAVEGKWMSAIVAAIQLEMERISQTLAQRVKELAERYESPLPVLTDKVDGHLKKMGIEA